MNEFGNYLYSLRKSKGMTQQELADKLGVTNKAVSKWETGEAYPETAQLIPLSDIFGVTVDDLLRGKEEALRETKQTSELLSEEQESIQSEKKKFRSLGKMISTIIMLSATAIYLLLGFVWELWHPGWVVFPVGGILCGIISAIFNSAIYNKER
ncbi:MAG: helix-turn-helix transcriptional regulator [Clostridiales bacterium]|nr:helix-turn-helix transcriptional regulator [Clostridiales bacterium]